MLSRNCSSLLSARDSRCVARPRCSTAARCRERDLPCLRKLPPIVDKLRHNLAKSHRQHNEHCGSGRFAGNFNEVFTDLDMIPMTEGEQLQHTEFVRGLKRGDHAVGVTRSTARCRRRNSQSEVATVHLSDLVARDLASTGANDGVRCGPRSARSGKRVILGPTGIGKSMMASQAGYVWSDLVLQEPDLTDDELDPIQRAMSEYELVFRISARNHRRLKEDNLANLLIPHAYLARLSQDDFNEILTYLLDNGERVLVIFDGADEMSDQLAASAALQELLSADSFPGRTLLVTSRVSSSTDPFIENAELCAMVMEMDDAHVDTFVKRRLQSNFREHGDDVVDLLWQAWTEALEVHRNKLLQVVQLPVLANIAVGTYIGGVRLNSDDVEGSIRQAVQAVPQKPSQAAWGHDLRSHQQLFRENEAHR